MIHACFMDVRGGHLKQRGRYSQIEQPVRDARNLMFGKFYVQSAVVSRTVIRPSNVKVVRPEFGKPFFLIFVALQNKIKINESNPK